MLTNHYRVKFISINYHKRVGKSSIHPGAISRTLRSYFEHSKRDQIWRALLSV